MKERRLPPAVGRAEPLRLLNQGRFTSPDVLLVRVDAASLPGTSPAEVAVLKDFGPRSPLVRATFGRFVIGREAKAYAQLAGHPQVPRLLMRASSCALLIEYRPGRRLSRSLAAELPSAFLARLEHAIERMHTLGVVHLDLKHRDNVLLGEADEPVLIDFASAVCFRPGSWLYRHYRPSLMRYDQAALRKWQERLRAGAMPSKRGPWRRLRRWLRSR